MDPLLRSEYDERNVFVREIQPASDQDKSSGYRDTPSYESHGTDILSPLPDNRHVFPWQ